MLHDFWALENGDGGVFDALEGKDTVNIWKKWKNRYETPSTLLRGLNLLPDPKFIDLLPRCSFMLRIPFKLTSPFMSKDECHFQPLDNPIRKEKTFKVPMIVGTSWKGALRSAIRRENGWEDDDPALLQIFGQSRGDEGNAGCLRFFPTFFDNGSKLEVMNPHSRLTGAGAKGPIMFECLPARSSGDFFLLYVPNNADGQDHTATRKQVALDLQCIADGIRAMLTVYGFGAKTSSGYGVAEMEKGGKLVIHYPDEPEKPSLPPEPVIPECVVEFNKQYDESDLDMRIKAWRERHKVSKKAKALEKFKAAKQEWLAYQEALKTYQNALEKLEAAQTEEPPKTMVRGFDSFKALEIFIEELKERWSMEEPA